MRDDQLEQLFEKIETVVSKQGATTKSVRALAEDLSNAEDEIIGALSMRLDRIEHANIQTILSRITAEELADYAPNAAICGARNIQWARRRGEADPLPPAPVDLVPRHDGSGGGNRRRRDEDSLVVKTDRSGATRVQANLKAKTIAAWLLAAISFVLGAYHMVSEHLEKKIPPSNQPPPSIAAPP